MKVLAIGCHPDDLELNAYGTLAKYVKQGHKVWLVRRVCLVDIFIFAEQQVKLKVVWSRENLF